MLPEISRYKQIRTEAGEPLEAYQQLFDRVAKTYDAQEQASTGYQMFMANLKGVEGDQPFLNKYKEGVSKSLSDIAKEASETNDYSKSSMKVKDLGLKILTDSALKHVQEFYASAKPDMDIMNSPDKALYMGSKDLNKLRAINPDGTFNTYKSDIEKRMDWNKSADEAIEKIKGTLSQRIEKMSPEQRAELGIEGGMLNFIETESLQNKDLADKMDAVMNFAVNDPALNQFGRFNGGLGEGGKGLDSIKKLIADRFSTGTYKLDKSTWQSVGAFNPKADTTKTTGDDTDAAFQFSEFGTIRNNINSESFKTFDINPDSYTNESETKEAYLKRVAEQGKLGIPVAPKSSFKVSDKDKEFLTMVKNSNKAFKDMPLNKVADEVNKNKDAYVAQFKKNFGQQNMLIGVANKVEVGSGFDKTAKSLALNSKSVLVEGADPKDKGKTLGEQLKNLDIDVSDLEGATKEIVGINIDAMSDDADYNGGLVTQVTTKDGSKTFKVVSYNETYKNTFKGFADVKKDLMRIGNTGMQKKQLESGYPVESKSFYKIGDTEDGKKVEAKAVKRMVNGVLTTGIKLKIGEDVTDTPYNVGAFDKMMTNLLANDKYFKTNFK